jgi:hypothetical protein
MTPTKHSDNFMFGLLVLDKYRNDKFSINIVEVSTVVVEGLNRISKEDIEALTVFGWEAGKNNEGDGWAQFSKLEYVDI